MWLIHGSVPSPDVTVFFLFLCFLCWFLNTVCQQQPVRSQTNLHRLGFECTYTLLQHFRQAGVSHLIIVLVYVVITLFLGAFFSGTVFLCVNRCQENVCINLYTTYTQPEEPVHSEHSSTAWAVMFSLSLQVWCQLCPGPCQCPSTVPRCPVGVPLLLDSCGCCQVCARQEGEACTERLPCDTQRGLQCDYSASFPRGPGQCVGVNTKHSTYTPLEHLFLCLTYNIILPEVYLYLTVLYSSRGLSN